MFFLWFESKLKPLMKICHCDLDREMLLSSCNPMLHSSSPSCRVCVFPWSSCHHFPSASFIPLSSPEALVYSNQGLAEKCQKAFRSAIFPLGAEPQVPALIRQQSHNNKSRSSQPVHNAGLQHPGPPGAKCHTNSIYSHRKREEEPSECI